MAVVQYSGIHYSNGDNFLLLWTKDFQISPNLT